MANVLIVVYLLIVISLIAVILLQRSEGGGLGIGGGSGGGLTSARGAGNLLTRTTAILAGLFMATAIGLTVVNDLDRPSDSIIQDAAAGDLDSNISVLDALNDLQPSSGSDLALPNSDTSTETDLPAVDAADATPQDTSDLAAPVTETPASETPNEGTTQNSSNTSN